MWEMDCKEDWAPKNWCFQVVGLEKTLESPLDSKEIKPVDPKGNQSWILIGRSDTDVEASTLGQLMQRVDFIGKDPDAGKDWGQEEKGVTEDEMVGWHHQLNGHEFEQTLGKDGRTEKPGVLQSMGLQRVGYDLGTEQQQHQKERGGGMDWEFGFSRCKVLYTEWINNKILLIEQGTVLNILW